MRRFTILLFAGMLACAWMLPLGEARAQRPKNDAPAETESEVEVDLSDLQAEMQTLEQKIKQLSAEYKAAPESAKPAVRRSLRELLDKQFTVHQKMRERELAAVEERVKKLRSALDEREAEKDDLIDRRLDKLAGGGASSEEAAPPTRPAKKPPAAVAANDKKPEKTPAKKDKSAKAATKKKKPAESDEFRKVEVDWSAAELVTLASPGAWKVTVNPPADAWPDKVKAAPLPPKSNFFEAQRGLAINRHARKAAVGYLLGEPKPSGTTRVMIADLATGKTSKPAAFATQMSPLALHDDGETILMRREEWGFGNLDRLEVWTTDAGKVYRSAEFVPYDSDQGAARDVLWAEFLDADRLATSSRWGKVAIWKFPELVPICTFTLGDGSGPALSPDRKLIGYCNGSEIGLFDVDKMEVVAQQATPSKLQWPTIAFSPSGKRLGCVAFDKVLVWDVETGVLQQTIPGDGLQPFHHSLDFPAENCVLCAGKYLIDIDNRLKWWTYEGHEQVKSSGGWTIFGLTNGEQAAGSITPLKIPHPAATDLLNKALKDPELFVLRAGTKVKINTSAIADPAQRSQAELALNKRLETIDCKSGADGAIELVASVEGPKDRKVSYMFVGDYTVKEYISRVKFVYQGQTAWETSSTNVPFFIQLKDGENIDSHLKACEKPDFGLFERVELPKFLQKPSAAGAAGNSLTIGRSQVTTGGLK